MREAGYILYPECQTEADIQSYKKYYALDEELCTFRGNRLDTCRVWFAVKENVADIRREDFSAPKRQDEYGTSVISIQFTKDEYSTLSIKNRYNHTVINPDNTFNSDLNNIIPGLADAFEKDYGVKEKNKRNKFKLDDYVLADGKYYHYNNWVGVYCCDNNVVIENGNVRQLPTDSQILVDNFAFDFAKNTITNYSESIYKNSFIDSIGKITNMSYSAKDGIITIKVKNGEDVVIGVNGRNTMTSLYNANVKQVKNWFLAENKNIESISIPNLQSCEEDFLSSNTALKKLNLPELQKCGDRFLYHNRDLQEISLPNLQSCGNYFLTNNVKLKELSLPELRICKGGFLVNNIDLQELNLPKLESCGDSFLHFNEELKELSLPELQTCGGNFLFSNKELKKLSLPKLIRHGGSFLYTIQNIKNSSFGLIKSQLNKNIRVDIAEIEDRIEKYREQSQNIDNLL